MNIRFSPILALIGIVATWLHGITVGLVMGHDTINRFIMFTVIFVGPVLTLWATSKSVAVRRMAASMVYFLCALQATAWSLSIAWHRNPRKMEALPDFGHDILGPKWEKVDLFFFELEADVVPDIFLGGAIVSALAFALYHDLRWLIIRRVLTIYATLMLFRCFTVVITSLPDSHPRCREATPIGDEEKTGAASLESLQDNFQTLVITSIKMMIPIGQITCGDMVFSGHSMLLVLSALTWHTYFPRTEGDFNAIKFIMWGWSLVGLLTIVGTRLHYSLDVLLAWYLSITVWSSYHRIANDVLKGKRFCMVWLFDTLIIYPAIEYFESGVGREGIISGINIRTEDDDPLASPRFSSANLSPQFEELAEENEGPENPKPRRSTRRRRRTQQEA